MKSIFRNLKSGCAGFRLLKLICLLIIFLSIGKNTIHAQQAMDYTVHANIIYRFTKYINWPENKKNGDFVIGIVGDSPLFEALTKFIINKTAGSQRIIIKKFSASNDVFNCHILFISEDESTSLRKIAASTASTSTLIVTESEGLARKGSCINFVIVDEHLKLEINKINIERRSMGIASELLQLGIPVK